MAQRLWATGRLHFTRLLFWAAFLACCLALPQVGEAQGGRMILGLSFSSDGKHLAVCGDRVRIYDVASGKRLKEIDDLWKRYGVIREIAFSPTKPDLLVIGPDQGPIRLLRLGEADPVRSLEGHDGMTSSLAFSPDGNSLATGSVRYIKGEAAFGKLRYWSVDDGRLVHSEDRDDAGIDAISISQSGKQIAFCTKADLEVFDIEPWSQVGSVTLPAGNLAGSPFGLETVFARKDEFVLVAGGICVPSGNGCQTTGLLWRVDLNGSAKLEGEPRPAYCRSVSVTRDGERFVTGHQAGPGSRVTMFDVRTGDLVWTAAGGMRLLGLPEVYGVRVSPDGKSVTWCSGGEIQLVDAENGESMQTIEVVGD